MNLVRLYTKHGRLAKEKYFLELFKDSMSAYDYKKMLKDYNDTFGIDISEVNSITEDQYLGNCYCEIIKSREE